jgi:hypothetical protein
MPEGEGHDPLLGQLAGLVGHPWRSPLTGPEHLQTRPQDRTSPAVVGRAMDVQQAARQAHVAQLGSQAEQPEPELEEHVIIDHGAAPPALRFRHDKHEEAAPFVTRRSRSRVSGEPETVQIKGLWPAVLVRSGGLSTKADAAGRPLAAKWVSGQNRRLSLGVGRGRLTTPEWASDSSGFSDGHLTHFGMGT